MLRPVSFDWKDKTNKNKRLGLIAQEVQLILPDIVDVGDDEKQTLGINYSALVPVLTKAIQEQQTEIKSLRSENMELKNQLLDINKRLDKLEK